jgi:hypothetical protein
MKPQAFGLRDVRAWICAMLIGSGKLALAGATAWGAYPGWGPPGWGA